LVIINYDGSIPKEVILEDKTELEQIRLIQELEEEDKQTIFRLVEKMLTNKKFKDFFTKNAVRYKNTKPTAKNGGFIFICHTIKSVARYIFLLIFGNHLKILFFLR
jgi:hypothetical protein